MKPLATLSIFGWSTFLVAQAFFLRSAFSPEHRDLLPAMTAFLVISTLKVAIFAALGLALSLGVLLAARRGGSPSPWPLWALAGLSLLALWGFCLSGLAIFWHPPLGDGTLVRALSSYGRLHYGGSAVVLAGRLLQQFFLLASTLVWPWLAWRASLSHPHPMSTAAA